ncbi:MAG: HPF/RaiA family ribosome-associated protein [Rhodospirillaceae bacterium]|nr:HPF/RaiA family ribosome-associated protein [Rhodospirillaceae bacterium]
MAIPLQVSFRNMDPSPAVEAHIREKVEKLSRFSGRIIGCRVTVEAPRRRSPVGKLYNLRIEISVPGRDITVTHAGRKDPAHADVYVAVRDAFDAAARQLEDHVRVLRGDVKAHEAPPHGRVSALFPDYGFIQTADGLEVYFHRNSVAEGDFDKLEVGDEVRLVIAEGESEKGPQATTVVPLGKHHIVG